MKSNDEHLERLLDAYFDGELDAAAKEELDQMVASSSQARDAFWARASMESTLENWASQRKGETLAWQPKRKPALRGWARHLPAVAGWSVAALLTVAWLGERGNRTVPGPTFVRPDPETQSLPAGTTPVAETADDTPVAYLSRSAGLERGCGILPGQVFRAGREVVIGGGVLELDFYSGARVSIQGPARFVPDSDMKLSVVEGQVQVDVPDSAKGFVLSLPDGTITDFGTSFGVVVKENRTSRLQVSRGEVELAGTKDGADARRILEGQALSISSEGGPREIDFRPMSVTHSLETLSAEYDQLRASRWDEECRRIAEDPALLVHFRFLPDEQGGREISNRATGPGLPRTGTVIAAEWSRGRWEGKPALAFNHPSDRVRVDVPGEFPQVTFAAWVKTDGLPRRYNGLFLSEFGIPGEAHWQFSPDGRFYFGVRPKEERPDWSFHRAFSEPVISIGDFGTWRLLATTYDSVAQEVVHFVDGVEVHRSQIGDSIPLRFGRATLGNFFDPKPEVHATYDGLGEEWSFRNWSGAIDEFLLFSRVLDGQEILKLHETGRPD
jgi:hypothetical protein